MCRLTRSLGLLWVLCVVLAGCGGGDDSSGSSPEKSLDGDELSDSGDLIGTWVYVTDGDFVGFEFMKEGKALVTPAMAAALTGLNSGMMMSYDVLDGGRLTLSAANGQTQVFHATIDGDLLELWREAARK